jgi:hypothetical protein
VPAASQRLRWHRPGRRRQRGRRHRNDGDDGAFGLGWGLAPIRWGGSVGVQMRRQSSAGGAVSGDTTGLFNLRGASHLYAPWLAQVSANVSLMNNRRNSQGSDGVSVSDGQTSFVGGGMLQLFPVSRFPFVATFDRSDSRMQSSLVANDYTNTRLNLRQSYRSETGAQNGSVGFDRSVVESGRTGGTDVVNAVYGDYSHAFENQTSQLNGRYSQSTRDTTGEGSTLMNYYARHTYRYDENLNLETSTLYNDNRLRYRSTNGLAESNGRYLQMNSSASWRPEDEEIPLTVTAGAMLLNAQSAYNGENNQAQSLSGNVSATYAWSPNLLFMGTGLMTQLSNKAGTKSTQDRLTNVGGAVNYTGDPLTFGNFSYNWNTGGSVNRQSGGSIGSNQMLMFQASHSLTRDFSIAQRQSLQVTMSQAISQNSDQVIGASTTLNHTGGGTWRFSAGDQTFGSVGLSASDMRTSGANEGVYQFVYLQLNGNGQLTPRSSFNANVTLQWSLQDTQMPVVSGPFATTAPQNDRNRRMTVFGSASYSHQRAFGVQGLRYNLSFNANSLLMDDRLLGNANAQPDRYTYWLENRLDYRIGMLDFQASATVTELGGKKNAQVFFRATREFGKY